MKRYFPYLYDKDDDGNEEYSVVVEENSTGKYCLYEDHRNEKAKDSILLDVNAGIIITLKAEIDELKQKVKQLERDVSSLRSKG